LDNPAGVTYSAYTDDYIAFTFGLGFEVNLPIPVVDVRIPISLRGNYNPGVTEKRDDRGTYVIGTDAAGDAAVVSASYSTEWKFQAVGQWGIAAHF